MVKIWYREKANIVQQKLAIAYNLDLKSLHPLVKLKLYFKREVDKLNL